MWGMEFMGSVVRRRLDFLGRLSLGEVLSEGDLFTLELIEVYLEVNRKYLEILEEGLVECLSRRDFESGCG